MVKTVVILGGGYYGMNVAKILDKEKDIHVILIDQREALNHKIGGARAIVAGGIWAERATIPYEKLFTNKNNKIIHGHIESVTDDEVILQDYKESIKFDAIILATGAVNNSPGEVPTQFKSRNDMINYYENVSKQLSKSKKIVIVGGGAVAAEIAGELSSLYGNKKNITIVHNSSNLFSTAKPSLPDKFKINAKKTLTKLGVNIILNKKVLEPQKDSNNINGIMNGDFNVKLSDGEMISNVDTIIFATGTQHFNKKIYPENWLDEKLNYLVSVNENLRVENSFKAFAIGDCTNIPEGKLGGLAAMQAPICAKNVISFFKKNNKLLIYKPNRLIFLILPFGPNNGLSILPFGEVGKYITGKLKGKGLFANANWTAMNYSFAPKYSKNWLKEFQY